MEDLIKQALANIVGPENFTDSLVELAPYAYDASDHHRRPEAAVWPASTGQVSRILALADEHRFPVVPRGAGTSLSGGAVPALGGLMMDMSKMNRILDIRIADRQVIVETFIPVSCTIAPTRKSWNGLKKPSKPSLNSPVNWAAP